MTNHSSSSSSSLVPADKKHSQLAQPFWPSDARSNARTAPPAYLASSDNASYLASRMTGGTVGLSADDAAAFGNAILWEQPADSLQAQLGRERFAAEEDES